MSPAVLSFMLVLAAPARPEQGTVPTVPLDSIAYAVRVSDLNLMGLTVSNYGFIGNC